jgi:hypothetical protein
MNNKREYFYNIEPIEDINWDGAEQGKDNTTISIKDIEHKKNRKVEPTQSKVAGVKSLGEILQSDFKHLFERRSNYD